MHAGACSRRWLAGGLLTSQAPGPRATAASIKLGGLTLHLYELAPWCCSVLQATLKQKEAELELVAPYSKSYGRTFVRNILESEGGGVALVRWAGMWTSVSKAAADRQAGGQSRQSVTCASFAPQLAVSGLSVAVRRGKHRSLL